MTPSLSASLSLVHLLLAATGTLLFLPTLTLAGRDSARSINIINESGHKVVINWIHPDTGERVLQSNPHIFNGATFSLNSFATHMFEASELPKKDGECGDGEDEEGDDTCKVGFFTVNYNDEQIVFIKPGMEVTHQDNKSVARDMANSLLETCQQKALTSLASNKTTPQKAITSLTSCVSESVSTQMEEKNDEIAFQTQVRKQMGELYENYTCADHDLPTTEAVRSDYWRDPQDPRKHLPVDIMLDRPASKIHVVQNFITPEECQAMEDQAKPKLHKATVANGKGGSELSPNRKAMQAGIKIPWHLEDEAHPLTTISRRVYDYVNHVLDLDIEEHGQEDLMSIQYEGRGEDDDTPDRYMPHCDGDCTGMEHKTGTRMATMVMYCMVPDVGGATNFRNSGVHVVPEQGSATFFSYIDPETKIMDNGWTEHSGCPVIEGEKKIVTQWVRLGVDHENPWDSFNTLGIKISDAESQ